ncbi:hypothetical protein BJ138DRAFT_1166384 [Hygrophoropsis aurantiaca]|uniref:Uncharacterized protein n=1 Tax=Hygrophoropsis aurantiaca TaxID=72124 RepID=A0ACB7ZUJ8_9AGAM|nr:hypothetical protein BJ138DRAFT_1166384 [Hygrophoropsis aurantiaca]
MGICGYAVYRYKSYYFFTCHRSDDPNLRVWDLGKAMLGEARNHKHLKRLRAILNTKILHVEGMSDVERKAYIQGQDNEAALCIHAANPYQSFTDGCMYEIDLDRNVFHINEVPFFSLANLPPRRLALERLITEDSYNIIACKNSRYKFGSVRPPAFEEALLHPYHRQLDKGKNDVSYIDMLGLPEQLTEGEWVRLHLLQIVVGYSINRGMAFNSIQEFRLAAGNDDISDKAWHEAFTIANIAFAPPIFFSWQERHGHSRPPKRQDVCWVRRDVFIHITPHLSNKNHMQAAIARVIEAVRKKDRLAKGIVFGVLFSFLHCVIVRIDLKAEGLFTHTPPMNFLPSYFAKGPSTPGITALVRFGCRYDPDLFSKALAFHTAQKPNTMTHQAQGLGDIGKVSSAFAGNGSILSSENTWKRRVPLAKKVPAEVWLQIAARLPSVDSLLNFGLVSRVHQQVAEVFLECTHIDNWRILAVAPSQSSELRFAQFRAVCGNSYAKLYVGRRRRYQDRHLPNGSRYLRVFSTSPLAQVFPSVPLVLSTGWS